MKKRNLPTTRLRTRHEIYRLRYQLQRTDARIAKTTAMHRHEHYSGIFV